jgi:hypothetical protein
VTLQYVILAMLRLSQLMTELYLVILQLGFSIKLGEVYYVSGRIEYHGCLCYFGGNSFCGFTCCDHLYETCIVSFFTQYRAAIKNIRKLMISNSEL